MDCLVAPHLSMALNTTTLQMPFDRPHPYPDQPRLHDHARRRLTLKLKCQLN